jgi:hypothetical protein
MICREITFVTIFVSLSVKIQGESHNFDTSETDDNNQIALSPTIVKGERIKQRNYVCNLKVIYWFLITIFFFCGAATQRESWPPLS